MSVNFDGVNDGLDALNTGGISDWPISISAWYRASAHNARQNVVSCYHNTISDSGIALQVRGELGTPVIFVIVQSSGANFVQGGTGISADTWYHLGGIWTSSQLRCYVDGTSDATPITHGRSFVGQLFTGGYRNNAGSAGGYMEGQLAEMAVWDVDIGDAGMAALGAGASPTLVSAANLVHYWPLWNTANLQNSFAGANDFADRAGSAVSNGVAHAPNFYSDLVLYAGPPSAPPQADTSTAPRRRRRMSPQLRRLVRM